VIAQSRARIERVELRKYTKKEALHVAKFFAEVLDMKNKDIKIIFGSKHPFGAAGVRTLKNDEEVENTEDFDTIEITLFDISDIGEFPGWMDRMIFISHICHEMVHAKYPHWGEDQVADFEANLIGLLNQTMKRE